MAHCSEPLVCIIDDDSSVCLSLSRLLGAMGFDTETFDSAERFMKRKCHEEIGCLVLDIHMPGLDGYDLLDRLDDMGHRIAAILMTGRNPPTRARTMKRDGVTFLMKPFDDTQLLDAVTKAIETTEMGRRKFVVA